MLYFQFNFEISIPTQRIQDATITSLLRQNDVARRKSHCHGLCINIHAWLIKWMLWTKQFCNIWISLNTKYPINQSCTNIYWWTGHDNATFVFRALYWIPRWFDWWKMHWKDGLSSNLFIFFFFFSIPILCTKSKNDIVTETTKMGIEALARLYFETSFGQISYRNMELTCEKDHTLTKWTVPKFGALSACANGHFISEIGQRFPVTLVRK